VTASWKRLIFRLPVCSKIMANIETNDLTPDMIRSVYSGRNGKCCCGCAGKHSTEARQITRILNLVKKNPTEFVTNEFVSTVVGKRVYIAYLKGA
jgi:hypothetical protein